LSALALYAKGNIVNLGNKADNFALRIGEASSICFLLSFVLTLKEVFWRYVLGAPSSWAQDVITMLCAIAFSLGGAYVMAERRHIRVTVVSDRFPKPIKNLCEKAGLAMGAIYLTALTYGLANLAYSAIFRSYGGKWSPESLIVPPHLPVPSITKTALATGAILFLVVTISHLISRPQIEDQNE
jgi:TRAP-type mannitol/chloroaromatic compound transport system, small permease component